MLKVKISSEARLEILRYARFITNRGNPENARRWKARIKTQIQSLETYAQRFPVQHPQLGHDRVYKCVFESHNIYYKIDKVAETVHVVTILPAAQDTSANQ